MVFPSVPVYLDHPNWHQLQQPNPQDGSGGSPGQFQPQQQPQPPQAGGIGSSIRPGSMVDRARLAKLPLPEAGLKCPRCDSTNTKFCYFNNYSLTQPRHFCKTCRRYWTRGGALRSVPVGGGCRRNKRSKSSSSKSAANTQRQTGSNSTGASPPSCSPEMAAHFPQPSPQFPFIGGALQNLNHFGGLNMGSNIVGIQPQMGQTEIGFNLGLSSGGGTDQWKLPFLGGFEAPATIFPYQSEGVEATPPMVEESQLRSITTSSVVSQSAPVKSEEGQQGLNLSGQVLGISENNSYWSTNAWMGFSGLNSSSASHLL